MRKTAIVLSILALAVLAGARSRSNNMPRILQAPDTQLRVHRAPDIRFSVTNFGFWGSQEGGYRDSEFPDEIPPGAEFPANSGKENLFQGAIWIGATVDTFDIDGRPVLDTLVSIGNDGWWGTLFELLPAPPEGNPSIWRDHIVGDEEIFAICTDTVTDQRYVMPDPNDQRPHIPLGLKITQHSIGWSSAGFNQIFIVDFYMENLRNRDLHDVWFGIYYDGDVLHESENPYGNEQGAQDDLCGSLARDNTILAWIADNDGQPVDDRFDSHSSTGVMGITFLKASQPNLETNFNWWISNTDPDYDWGPQWQSNFDIWGVFPGGGRGTPGGDRAKYQMMSNRERDYDQAYSDLNHTGQRWISAPPTASEIANGFDTRYLISFGPIQIPSLAMETLTVAYMGGNNLHVDPTNYRTNLQYSTFDSASVAEYYNHLDFYDLLTKADSAASIVAHGFAQAPIGPPPDFRVASWNENRIDLIWRPTWYDQFREYRIYRGTTSGEYDPQKITPDNFRDTLFTDNDVINNVIYYYVIVTVKESNIEGGYSPEVAVNSGRPGIPMGLTAARGNMQIELTWLANPDTDIAGYSIYRALHGQDLAIIDSASDLSFTDTGLRNGLEYDYAISAYDHYGNESFLSHIVSAIPMGFDAGILLIDANRSDGLNPDHDSMIVFYQNALVNYRFALTSELPDSLTSLAPYSTIIWSRETVLGRFSLTYPATMNLLSRYLDTGGNLMVAGTRNLIEPVSSQGEVQFDSSDFRHNYLNLAGAYYPNLFTNTEFIGGFSASPGFPDFGVDSVRASRVNFPPGNNYGRLFGIGAIIPADSSEAIYNYNAVLPDTSSLHGRPIAVIHDGRGFKTATLEFPPYYVMEPSSFDILHRILEGFGETVGIEEKPIGIPGEFSLMQNYPNPFNATTSMTYNLPVQCNAQLYIYNLLGQRVATLLNGPQMPGSRSAIWNAGDVPSGVYFAQLVVGSEYRSIKLTLLK